MRNFMTTLSLGVISLFVFSGAALATVQVVDDFALPEPASMSLFAVGAAGLILGWKRKQKK